MKNIKKIIALSVGIAVLLVGAILLSNSILKSNLLTFISPRSQLALLVGAPSMRAPTCVPPQVSDQFGTSCITPPICPDGQMVSPITHDACIAACASDQVFSQQTDSCVTQSTSGSSGGESGPTSVTTGGSSSTLPPPPPPPPPIGSESVISGERGPSAADVVVGPGNIQIINLDVESGRFIYYAQGCAGSYVPYGTGAPLPPPPPPPISGGSNLSGEGGPTGGIANGSNSNPKPSSSVHGTGCAPWSNLMTFVDGENIGGAGNTALYACDNNGNKTSGNPITNWCEQVYFPTTGFTGTGQHKVSVSVSNNGINSSNSINIAFNNPPPPPQTSNTTQPSSGLGTLNALINDGYMFLSGNGEYGYLGLGTRIINLYPGTYELTAYSRYTNALCYDNDITIYSGETSRVTATGEGCNY